MIYDMKKKIIIIIIAILTIFSIWLLIFGSSRKEYRITFDSAGGTKINTQLVKKDELVTKPVDPVKEDYVFKEWQLDGKLFDFNSKIKKNIKLVAIYDEDPAKNVKYKVTFNTNGGSSIEEILVKTGSKATKPIDPTKDGYELDSWLLDGEVFNFDTPITKDITLTAKWKEDSTPKFNVTFNTNGGSKVSTQSIKTGERATKPANPTKTDYIFKEWQLDGKLFDFSLPITKDITITAVWEEDKTPKYKVTFNTDGGSGVAIQTIRENSKAKKPANPTKTGYTFKEWQLDGKTFDFNTPIKKDISLKAIWIEIITYKVTFNTDGGSGVAIQTINSGEKATKPANPTKSGYTFKEWQLDGVSYDFNSAVTRDISLKAVWIEVVKNYTISVTKVDEYSPDRRLTVKEDGVPISVSQIKYSDGVVLCNGSNTTVAASDIEGETSFLVVLNNGKTVTARVG